MTGLTRRERLRAELERDATAAARRITEEEGVEGLTLAAVARAVGVTPPALYRYFDGRAGLVRAVYDDVTAEFIETVARAVARQDPDDVSAQLHAATRAVLDWSMANRAGFDLLMGAAFPKVAGEDGIPTVILRELGRLFGELFARLLREGRLPHPAEEDIAPDLAPQLRVYRDIIGLDLPVGVALLMMTCWRQIYGLLCLAVYGHLRAAFGDHLPLFEDMMDDLLGRLGLTRSPGLRVGNGRPGTG
ncbi:TetR/AcrR family transcriptional regulator [Nonomuraea sp. NPDC047897]|uniref:TetR/AcrR family transcriptional regulator n=1 Tax=Nonomuraea sp. NPDC047897 TaxID=3364346 RepID=UPI00371F7893